MKKVAGAILVASIPFNSIAILELTKYSDGRTIIAWVLLIVILASAIIGFKFLLNPTLSNETNKENL